MFMAPKSTGPYNTVLTPNDPKGCCRFFFFEIEMGKWAAAEAETTQSYSISLLQQNARSVDSCATSPNTGKQTHTLTHSYRYRYIARVSRICEISLIKSTNVQIMQDVLKYGKHLNIS